MKLQKKKKKYQLEKSPIKISNQKRELNIRN
jgi:hypothetical protein